MNCYEDENESIRSVLLDSSPLEMCYTSSSNSMPLQSYFYYPRTNNNVKISTKSLIDSGCTAMAFADEESIVKRFGIEAKPLVTPRFVRLADGSSQAAISHYFVFRFHLGHHSENLVFYITKLSKSNTIILGII